MGLKRYHLVLLFALLLQWSAAPWLPFSYAAAAGDGRAAPHDVFPLAQRYRQELRARVALGSLLSAVRGTATTRPPRTWPPVPTWPVPRGVTRPNLLYFLMSLRW
jgi:hypothetical protein